MIKTVNVGAVEGSEAFLLISDSASILVDTGFAFCADKMTENIKQALGRRPLTHIFLTHSHYDHASGTPMCKAVWPDAEVVAGEYAKKIFSKESALKMISEMNLSAAAEHGVSDYRSEITEIPVDTVVRDGDTVAAGDIKFKVLDTPGHTKCTVAYYCEEEKLLISNETIGLRMGDSAMRPCFLVGYNMAVDSIRKVSGLDVRRIIIPHHGEEAVQDSAALFSRAVEDAETLKNEILGGYRDGKSVGEIVDMLCADMYFGETQRCQPEKAFRLNADIITKLIAKEFM